MTILELAKELGISKQAVTKKIKELGRFNDLEKIGNKYNVPEDIAEQLRQPKRQQFANEQQPTDNQVDEELAFLRRQIEIKDEQIASLSRALEQEQALHAADKQQLLLISSKPKGFLSFFRRKSKIE